MHAARPVEGARGRFSPSLESLFVATFVLLGFRAGARPITDNSMLLHLRTGMDMVRSGAIPRRDPYSFTAHGHGWVLQSWFPEWTYGWAERLGGSRLVVIEQGLLTAGLAWLIVRLARSATPARTALAAVVAIGVGVSSWSPRPLLFGLVALAFLVTLVERRLSRWWLLPVVWVWVSSHGSFPLGVAWLGARIVGEAIDGRCLPRETLRYLWAFGIALGVSALNPLGPRLLGFPLTVGDKREIFRTIVEWRSPDFQSSAGLMALAFLVLGLLVLLRRRVPWADLLPLLGFLAGALLAVRNLPAAGVVIAPVLGRALSPGVPPVRRPEPGAQPPAGPSGLNRAAAAALVGLAAIFVALPLTGGPAIGLGSYPVDAANAMESLGLRAEQHRVALQDFVGDYFDFRYGARARVFIDDRYDMFPTAVSHDYVLLNHADPGALEALDRRGVDVVLWERQRPIVATLEATGRWRIRYQDRRWVVLARR
ncbi:MAG: hypothetical protein ACYDAD_02805 [Acidimicrobiales bacterium]